MSRKSQIVISSGIAGAIVVSAIVLRIYWSHRPQSVKTMIGCVVRDDSDPRKQVPLADVEIEAPSDVAADKTRSDAACFFRLNLLPGIEQDRTILLRLRHPDYEPLNIYENAADKLYVLRMTPIPRAPEPVSQHPEVEVANIRVRYTETSTTTLNVGSAGKTFEVVNIGNVACEGASACSPDRKWRANVGRTSLDAGAGNEFRAARLTCIAGPCPFTRVDEDGFSRGGRTISASVRNWSDTVSFLLEAQVVRTMAGDVIHQSYPVKLGRGMDFTLPALAQGTSIESEIEGVDVVYPLGPTLALSWLNCTLKVDADQTRLYHCDLKPGFRFQ